jgi:hypothetical protein
MVKFRRWVWVALLGSLWASPVHAAEPATGGVDRAKDLFRRGVALYDAKDYERALELFSQSRSAFPSVQNTSNAAICLDRLGRYDEALELYEQLLTEFSAGLSAGERDSLTPAMATLRTRVANVWIAGDVAGAQVVVDGRLRATLPLLVPIRVLPGLRVARIIKDGYVTYEARVSVTAGSRSDLEVHLAPLANAGLLRIEDRVPGSSLFVDGLQLGATPWEGTLGPGRHVVWTRKDALGTGPKDVVVVQGQKAVVSVEAVALGAEISLDAEPPTAAIAVDGVEVAHGRWTGRLPLGAHTVAVTEAGYRPGSLTLASDTAKGVADTIRLTVDPEHPRWPRAAAGRPFLEFLGGYLFAPTLASDATSSCSDCPATSFGHGALAALRGGYRFPIGVSLEVMGGYVRAQSTFERTVPSSTPNALHPDVAYALTDRLLVHGPFGAFGAGYRHGLGARFSFAVRGLVGAAMSNGTDRADIALSAPGERVQATLVDSDPVSTAGVLLVHGDASVSAHLGTWELGLGLGALGFLLDGPLLNGRKVAVPYDPSCTLGSLACTPSGNPFPDERVSRRMVAISPFLSVGRTF